MIPKIIYTVWISDKPFPDKFRHFIDGWKELKDLNSKISK